MNITTKTSKRIIYVTIVCTLIAGSAEMLFKMSIVYSSSIMLLGLGVWLIYGMYCEYKKCKMSEMFEQKDKIGLIVGIILGLVICGGSVYRFVTNIMRVIGY